jgi:hypothetical protein
MMEGAFVRPGNARGVIPSRARLTPSAPGRAIEEVGGLAIVALILWLATACLGLALLRAGQTARRAIGAEPGPAAAPQAEHTPAVQAGIGAVPCTEDGRPPPAPRTTVVTPPGEHPLLEFAHPALASAGLAFWAMYTFVHYRPMAWISVAILVLTGCLGIGWLASTSQDSRRSAGARWRFPGRLAVLHGVLAACSVAVAVIVALIATGG